MRREGTTLDECELKLAAISVGVPTRSAQSRHSEMAVGELAFVQSAVGSGRLQLAHDLLSRSVCLDDAPLGFR